MTERDTRMCWIDVETTGLDAFWDVPLEIGLVLTDRWGEILDEVKMLVLEDNERYQRGLGRGQTNAFVRQMHEESGLWDDLRVFKTVTRPDADNHLVRWLVDHDVKPQTLGMAGNSIGSLDRPFALVHFPQLNEYLGHRNIDMSSLKEICYRVNPELADNLADVISNKDAADHRVLGDCRASIKEYQAYIENFLFVEEDDAE